MKLVTGEPEPSGTDHPGGALSALLDGELNALEESGVQDHLVGCGQCRQELEGVRLARAWVRALPPVDPPLGFLEQLQAPIQPSRWKAAIATLGAAAAVVATVMGLTPSRHSPTPANPNLVSATVTVPRVPLISVTTLVPNPTTTTVVADPLAPVVSPSAGRP